jgi:Haem-binding domain
MKRVVTRVGVAVVVVFAAIQFVPMDRSNPAVESEVPAPEPVRSVLRRACYDCHSNETVWPWYSRVAPVSWLVAHDVHEGREALNFSAWTQLSEKKQAKVLHKTWEEVSQGEMPPGTYLVMHGEAQLSLDDRTLIREWSQGGHGP